MFILTKEEAIRNVLEYYPHCWTWQPGGQWPHTHTDEPDVYFIEDVKNMAVVVHHTKRGNMLVNVLMFLRKNKKGISRKVIDVPGNHIIEGLLWGISGSALWMEIKLKNFVIWDDNILKEEK